MARKDKKSKQNKGKKPQAAQPSLSTHPVSAKPTAARHIPPAQGSARPARPLFRLIPLTMLLAFGLLSLKTVEIWQGGKRIQQALLVGDAVAEDTKPDEAKTDDKKTEEAKPEEADAEATPDDAKSDDAKADDTKPDEAAAAEESGHGGSGEAKKEEPPAPPPTDMYKDKTQPFSAREVDVLQKLSERREKLDNWEREVALREKVLEATEQRIDTKISEMKSLNDEIQKLLVAYKSEEDAKIRSLVKIYETMKPKDAARIFDQLDLDVLLMVVDRMSERKVAPVLAAMSPDKAKEVTQQLADQQKLQKPVEEKIEQQSLEDAPKF